MKTPLIYFVNQLKDIQDGKLWIGENFSKKLDTITNGIAFKKPLENLHSIAEIVSHLTVWKKESILKIETGEGSITDDLEVNWLTNKTLITIGWNHILEDYKITSGKLIAILEQKEDDFLDEIYYDTDYKANYKYLFLIEGMLHHDLYHLGQIGIILKMLQGENNK